MRFVYFVHAPAMNAVKIGLANDVGRRLDSLRSACPDELVLLASISSENAEYLEAQLHQHFSEHRIRGEWFHAAPAVMAMAQLHGRTQPESIRNNAAMVREIRVAARKCGVRPPSHEEVFGEEDVTEEYRRDLVRVIATRRQDCPRYWALVDSLSFALSPEGVTA